MPQSDSLPLPATSAPGKKGARYPEVDWLKTVSIVTVVLIHSLPCSWLVKISAVDQWVGQNTRFAVPTFLACSGFLYASSPTSRTLAAVPLRLQRLLLPYITFSLVAWCSERSWSVLQPDWLINRTPLLQQLLFGSALGAYYYVFVIVYLVCLTPLVARIPRRAFPGALFISLLLHCAAENEWIPALPTLFWQLRSPARHLAPFLSGWWAHLCYDSLLGVVRGPRRRCYLALLATLAAALGAFLAACPQTSTHSYKFAAWLQIYAILALLFFTFAGTSTTPGVVSWLSNASYPIYLSHLIFATPISMTWGYQAGSLDLIRILALWAAGLGNSAAFVLLARSFLGEQRARQWLG